MSQPVITLTTDFGLRDPYVGVMKGVIVSRCPQACVIDLTHAIRAQDVKEANFALHGAWRFFPAGTIHVVVVDPGVGSRRRILCARSHGMLFLAPDNGVLTGVLDSAATIHAVTDPSLFRSRPVSNTFHGRDIFASVAAHLANGLAADCVGPVVTDPIELERPEPVRTADGSLVGSVIHVDSFGNLISNISGDHLRSLPGTERRILFRGVDLGAPVESYAAVDVGCPLAIIDSFGFLEIAVNAGSAAHHFNGSIGDTLRVG